MCNLNVLLESQAVKTLLEKTIKVDDEKAINWLKNGAKPTETAKALIKKAGVEI